MADRRLPYEATEDANVFLDAEDARVDPDGKSVLLQRVVDRHVLEALDDIRLGQVPTDTHLSYGTVAGVAPGVVEELVAVMAGGDFRILGFTATGRGDGRFAVEIDGSPALVGRIHAAQRDVQLMLPVPVRVTEGSEVRLVVTNEADSTTDYEGTLVSTWPT